MFQLSLLDDLGFEDNKWGYLNSKQLESLRKVQMNPSSFKRYKKDNQFHELALEAFKLERTNIKYVREDLLTEEFWLEALEVYPDVLKEVVQYGEETEKITVKSVQKDFEMIKYSQLQPRLACLFVATSGEIEYFNLIREKKEEYCIKFVKVDGHLLSDLKEEWITKEVCIAAIKENPYAIQWLPEKFIIEELELLAVQISPEALDFVTNQTEEIVWTALKANPSTIEFVREQTEEMCAYAITHDLSSIEHVRFYPEEACLSAIKKNPFILSKIKRPTKAMVRMAVQQSPSSLRHLPLDWFTKEWCEVIVEEGELLFEFIPKGARSIEICMALYDKYPSLVKFFEF